PGVRPRGHPSLHRGRIWGCRGKDLFTRPRHPGRPNLGLMVTGPGGNQLPAGVILSAIGLFGMMYLSPASVSPSEYPEQVSSKDFATALGLVLTIGNIGAVVFSYVYMLGTELGSFDLGWWLIAGLSVLCVIVII